MVSGNVSLYNETNGKSIMPAPIIGMVGIINDIEKVINLHAKSKRAILVLGQNENKIDGWLGCSFYQEVI